MPDNDLRFPLVPPVEELQPGSNRHIMETFLHQPACPVPGMGHENGKQFKSRMVEV
jgi:hypothetical protein